MTSFGAGRRLAVHSLHVFYDGIFLPRSLTPWFWCRISIFSWNVLLRVWFCEEKSQISIPTPETRGRECFFGALGIFWGSPLSKGNVFDGCVECEHVDGLFLSHFLSQTKDDELKGIVFTDCFVEELCSMLRGWTNTLPKRTKGSKEQRRAPLAAAKELTELLSGAASSFGVQRPSRR